MKQTLDPSAQKSSQTGESRPPHGFKGVLEASPPLTPQDVMALALGLLLLAVLAVLVMKIHEKFMRKSVTNAGRDVVSSPGAWAVLRSEVDNIRVPEFNFPSEDARLLAWGDFTSSVSLCLRRGMELRTGLPMAESTTEEILVLLKKSGWDVRVLSPADLETLLFRLDAIRFAGVSGSHEEAVELLKKLKDAISCLEPSTMGEELSSNSVDGASKEAVRVFE